MIHQLKSLPENFQPVFDGMKTCEIRVDDRNPKYAVGDYLLLREYDPCDLEDSDIRIPLSQSLLGLLVRDDDDLTGRICRVLVTHIQRGYGLDPDYVAMSIKSIAL